MFRNARLRRAVLFALLPPAAVISAAIFLHFARAANAPPDAAAAQTREATDAASGPKKEVYAAIDDAIGTLEGPDYRQFMEFYAPVSYLQTVRRSPGGVTGFARRAERNKQEVEQFNEVLDRLRRARKATPTFNKEQTIATLVYVVEPERKLKPSDLPFAATAKKNKRPVKGYGGDLKTAIRKSIAALQAGRLSEYLANMLPVTDLQTGDVATFTKRLKVSPRAVRQTIADLKALQTIAPAFSGNGTVATYTVPTPQTREKGRDKNVRLPDRVFKFQKVGGNWRLYDNTAAMRAAVAKFRDTIPAVTETLVMEKFRDHWRISVVDRVDSFDWARFFYDVSRRSKSVVKTKTVTKTGKTKR